MRRQRAGARRLNGSRVGVEGPASLHRLGARNAEFGTAPAQRSAERRWASKAGPLAVALVLHADDEDAIETRNARGRSLGGRGEPGRAGRQAAPGRDSS